MKNAFNKLVKFVASADAGLVVSVVFILGVLVVLLGGVIQLRSMHELLLSQGRDAYDAYIAFTHAHRLPLGEFMMQAIRGQVPTFGSFDLAAGLWTIFVLAPLVAGCIWLARLSVRMSRRALLPSLA